MSDGTLFHTLIKKAGLTPVRLWEQVLESLDASCRGGEISSHVFNLLCDEIALVGAGEDGLLFYARTERAKTIAGGRLLPEIRSRLAQSSPPEAFAACMESPVRFDVRPDAFDDSPADLSVEEFLGGSFYDALVAPSRIVSIPAYLLRWLPAIGPLRLSIVLAMRQVLYLRGGVNGSGSRGQADVTFDEIARWAGVDERSVRAHIDDPEFRWFFQRVPYAPGERMHFDEKRGHVVRKPTRYVINTLPLTPADRAALGIHLRRALAEKGNNISDAVRHILSIPVKDILPRLPAVTPADWLSWEPAGATVRDAVWAAAGRQLSADEETLAAALAAYLTPVRRATIQVPWYRFLHWFPRLGQACGWFTVLCESRTYANMVTGEVRDTAQIDGGYGWFAEMLGVDQRTVRRWWQSPSAALAEPNRGDYPAGQPGEGPYKKARERFLDQRRRADIPQMLGQFVAISDEVTRQNQVISLKIRVALEEPLVPEHADLLRAAVDAGKVFQQLSAAEQDDILMLLQARQEEPDTDFRFDSGKPGTDFRFETGEPGTDSRFENREPGTDFRSSLVRISGIKSTLLNYRLSPKILKNYLSTLRKDNNPKEPPAARVVVAPSWNFQEIAERVFRGSKILERVGNSTNLGNPAILVSHLLYAASPAGDNTSVGYLVSKLEKNPSDAGWPFSELARLSPEKLDDLLRKALAPYDYYDPSSDRDAELWRTGMGSSKPEKLKELGYRLFGEGFLAGS